MKSISRILAQQRSIWAVWLVFWLCTLPELLLLGADHALIGQTAWRGVAYAYGGFWIGLLSDWAPNYPGQSYLMFASYAFLHGGPLHFLLNMVALFSLSRPIALRIEQWQFLALYILSLFGGAAMFGVLSDKIQPMVGASGALFGLAGAIAAWEFSDARAANSGLWPSLRLVAYLAILNLILWWFLEGQLAWETHLGGFLAGWIVAFSFKFRNANF